MTRGWFWGLTLSRKVLRLFPVFPGTARRRCPFAGVVESLESRLLPVPSLVSIGLVNPGASLISATRVDFLVTFNEPVTGVSVEDFRVSGNGVTAGKILLTGSEAIYTVTVTGIAGNGSLGIHLVDDRSIRDVEGQPLYLLNAPSILAARLDFLTRESPESVTASDVNNDGRSDLIVTSGDTVGVLLANNDGTLQARQEFQTGSGASSAAVGDVNHDGRVDLVVANSNSSSVSLLLGNGDGTFQSRQDIAIGSGPGCVVLGDLNDDDILDVAVANSGADTVSILLGRGDGTFQARNDITTGRSPESVALGDLNGDGITDLTVANEAAGLVSVLLGLGDGTFQSNPDIDPKSAPSSVAIGDLNGDGRADLVVGSRDSNRVSVLLGNGDGTFQDRQDFATGSRPRSVALGDLNGDGRLDLVVANQGSGALSVLLGTGNGKFQSKLDFKTGSNANSVAIGDVNGDGSLDVACSNNGSASVSVMLGFGNINGYAVIVDQTPPILVISSTAANPTDVSPIPMTVKVGEAVAGLTESDLLVTGGVVGGFTSSGKTSTFQITPTGPGVVTVDILADSAQDAAGNGNQAAIQFSRSFGTATIAPVAQNGTLSTLDGTTKTGTLIVADGDSSPAALTISVVNGPAHGMVQINDPHSGGYTYTPVAGYHGPDSFTFHAHDGSQFGNTATVAISVAKINTPALIGGTASGTVTEDSVTTVAAGTLLLTDPDDGENVFRSPLSLEGTYGTFTFNDTTGEWTYTLDNTRAVTSMLVAGEQVSETLEVTSQDATANAEITVMIIGNDDPPIITLNPVPLTYRVTTKQVVAIDNLATITDADSVILELTGSILKVSGQKSKDTLSILKQGGISLKSKNVLFGDTIIGTFTGGSTGKSLTVKLKNTANAESVQVLLRSISFKSTDKVAGIRTMQFQITSLVGQNTIAATRQIQITK